jgi:hypothetical protein
VEEEESGISTRLLNDDDDDLIHSRRVSDALRTTAMHSNARPATSKKAFAVGDL